MNTILEIKQLTKRYGDKTVVDTISFEVKEGEILCILGPNGAGKSTTINMLSGVLGHDGGNINYQEKDIYHDLRAYKKRLGVVPQEIALYEDLTALQNIHFFASLYGLKGNELKEKCNKALAFVGLSSRAKEKVNTFSGGMKRRLNIACAIAHNPELLIMDEPTVGVDPQSRNHILNSIKKLCAKGMSVIYTTHYMEEVEEISTRIIIVDEGKIIAEGDKESLKEQVADERTFVIEVDNTEIETNEFYRIEGIRDIEVDNGCYKITTLKSVENLDRIIGSFLNQSARIQNISCIHANLETVFLKMTGKSLRD